MNPSRRIMLIEDSPTQALDLSNLLERHDWAVEWVSTAEQAIDRIAEPRFDLIILDHCLPGIQGDAFCRRVRMNIDTRSVPILMLTMSTANEAELRSLESGADDFVPKSADPEVLLARIRALLNASSLESSIPRLANERFRRARLLTIDDSPTYQEYLVTTLEQEGYLIERAMSGEEGLKRILSESFDCALVDLVMPGMNGIEVCRQVRDHMQLAESPIALLVLTGQESKDDLTQALEGGADDFVGKSSDITVLKGRIRALLRRKFCQEENRRIAQQLKHKEHELLRATAAKEVAEARAALNDELERRVTERTAELAAANGKLAQQTQENELFVYSVSHDLRSPLVNLQGFSRELTTSCHDLREMLACESLPGELRSRCLELIDVDMNASLRFIQSAVSRLSNIIDALLRLSRAGRVEYRSQAIDLQAMVGIIVDSLADTIERRSAKIMVDHLPQVWGDPTAVEQVVANLLNNALNYLAPGRRGEIRIGALPDETPGLATIYVQDNGVGIPREFCNKLFRPFQRLQPDLAPGEGIGLSMAQRIVARHGGKIWFESTPDEGTTFYVQLAANEQPANLLLAT